MLGARGALGGWQAVVVCSGLGVPDMDGMTALQAGRWQVAMPAMRGMLIDRRARFEEIYQAYSGLILAYAVRRTDNVDDAADAVAETFMVAWRRLEAVPDGEEARPLLYGVARRGLANRRRGSERRRRLDDRLRAELTRAAGDGPSAGDAHDLARISAALDQLAEDDRELLILVAVGDGVLVVGLESAEPPIPLPRLGHMVCLAKSGHQTEAVHLTHRHLLGSRCAGRNVIPTGHRHVDPNRLSKTLNAISVPPPVLLRYIRCKDTGFVGVPRPPLTPVEGNLLPDVSWHFDPTEQVVGVGLHLQGGLRRRRGRDTGRHAR